jgi:hypothetical protein
MKSFYTFMLLLLTAMGANAQIQDEKKPEPIETDRPDQTESPSIVPKGMIQVETGFSFEQTDDDIKNLLTPSVLWKYGVTDKFELRLITEFASEDTVGETLSGFKPILVGLKVSLSEEKGIIPKTSFIAHLLLPNIASEDFKAEHYAGEFRFTMQHTLSDKVKLGYNLGAEWDGESPDATFVYTFTTGFSITEKFGIYAEVFGFAPENETAYHSFDGGITYLLSDNAMIDASGGFGLTENAPDYYAALGFSFRL